MRYGYSKELAAYVESVPQLARPIVETVVTTTSDIKDTKTDFSGADSTASFHLFDEGGIRLSGAGSNTLTEQTTSLTGADITSLTPPLSSPIDVGVIEWNTGTTNPDTEIFAATAYLDENTGAGKEVTDWYAAIFRLDSITDEGGRQVWNLLQLGEDSTPALTGAQDYTFTFAKGQSIPVIGGRPPIIERGSVIGDVTPKTILMVWALKGNGEVASNVAWECDSGNSSVTNGGHTIARYQLTTLDDALRTGSMQYTASGPNSGVPRMAMLANTGYSTASMDWTAAVGGNDLDLGAAPGADTDIEVVFQGATPSDTSIAMYLNDLSPDSWVQCFDGDIVGVDNSSNGGADLTGLTRQQTYNLRVTLTTSSDTSQTPRVFRAGIREVTTERVDGLVEIDEAGWAVDPVSCATEIPTISMRLYRDGVKDFRSWADSLFADNHLNDLLLRVWIGHPDLARRYWLHVDDFLIGTYEPGRSGIAVKGISPLQYVLKDIPPKIAASRDPISYDGSSLKAVYDDLLTTQVGVAGRYIGPGFEGSTSTQVTKTISARQQAYDPLRQINFINGSAMISSQGRFKVMPLFDDVPPETDANFPYEEVEVLAIDTGFDKRITSYDVPYGWDGAAYTGERENTPSQTVLDNLGPTAFGQGNELDAATAQWIEDSTTADAIGSRMVENFLTGMCQIRFRSDTPKPWLEPGDSCAFEQDVYVGRDPRTGDSIRGRMWARGVITQCHDVMGREFTVWVRSWVDVIPSATPTDRNPKYFDYMVGQDGDNIVVDQLAAVWTGVTPLLETPSILGWVHDLTFSATDNDTVAWGSGTISLSDGVTTYSIVAGNTGNMTASTTYYVYLDTDTSTTVLQSTTTPSSAVGDNKILVAVCRPAVAGTDATFMVYGGSGDVGISQTVNLGSQVSGTLTSAFADAGLINSNVTINADGSLSGAGAGQASLTSLPGTIAAGQIAANAVIAGKINALAVTAGTIAAGVVTTTEIAANTITAGNIAANTITANEIASNTITATQIAAGTITTTELATGTLAAGNIEAGTIIASVVIATTSFTAANPVFDGSVAVEGGDGYKRVELTATGNYGAIQFYESASVNETGSIWGSASYGLRLAAVDGNIHFEGSSGFSSFASAVMYNNGDIWGPKECDGVLVGTGASTSYTTLKTESWTGDGSFIGAIVEFAGNVTGTNDAKGVRITAGGTSAVLFEPAAGDTGAWHVKVMIAPITTSSQRVYAVWTEPDGTTGIYRSTRSINTVTTTFTLTLDGRTANASDEVECDLMISRSMANDGT